jgi:hypothetical protein
MASGVRFTLHVDEIVLAEDLARITRLGQAAISPVIDGLKRTGVPGASLKRCQAEHLDGTDLAGCVKLYIPQPDGPWGAVFTGDTLAGKPILILLAVGRRHHPSSSTALTVYQLADRRLNG